MCEALADEVLVGSKVDVVDHVGEEVWVELLEYVTDRDCEREDVCVGSSVALDVRDREGFVIEAESVRDDDVVGS